MSRYDLALKKPKKPREEIIENVRVNENDILINLRKLNPTPGDIIIAQLHELVDRVKLHEVFDLINNANTGLSLKPPIFVIVLNAGTDIRFLSEDALKKMGLQKIQNPNTIS